MELVVRTDQIASSKWIDKILTNEYTLIKEEIPKAGSPDFLNLTEKLKNILRLDKPDIIISTIRDGLEKPLISIELSACKLQSQHIEQRMARIVAAAELKYSERIFKNSGELVNEISINPLKVRYILGFSNKSWKLVDFVSGV